VSQQIGLRKECTISSAFFCVPGGQPARVAAVLGGQADTLPHDPTGSADSADTMVACARRPLYKPFSHSFLPALISVDSLQVS